MLQNFKIIRPTDGQRRELKKLGYTDEHIDKMSKSQAQHVLGLLCQQSIKKKKNYKSMSAEMPMPEFFFIDTAKWLKDKYGIAFKE